MILNINKEFSLEFQIYDLPHRSIEEDVVFTIRLEVN